MSPNRRYRTPFHCPHCRAVVDTIAHAELPVELIDASVGVMAQLDTAMRTHAKTHALCLASEDWKLGCIRGLTVDTQAETERITRH